MSNKSRALHKKNNSLSRNPSKTTTYQEIAYHRSAPLPFPAELEQYEKILPGAAERIFLQFENQAHHRQDLEKKVIDSDCKSARMGLHYGLAIGIVTILCGTFAIIMGQPVSGSLLGTGGLISLVGVFVYGSRQKRKELAEKQKLPA